MLTRKMFSIAPLGISHVELKTGTLMRNFHYKSHVKVRRAFASEIKVGTAQLGWLLPL